MPISSPLLMSYISREITYRAVTGQFADLTINAQLAQFATLTFHLDFRFF